MKLHLATCICLFTYQFAFSQTTTSPATITAPIAETKKIEPNGKALATVFFNYHYDLTDKVEKTSQFELTRTYLGYTYQFNEKITSKIIFDAGHDGKAYSIFAKIVSLEYKMNSKFTFEGGMIQTHAFDLQDKLYGYKYLQGTFMDINGYIPSADLGLKATYKPMDKLEFHGGLYNGEGFKKVQDDFGIHRASVDMVLRPIEGLTFKTYFDWMPKKDTAIKNDKLLQDQSILAFYLGYEKKDKYRAGVEYNMEANSGHKKDYQLNGLSVYAAYIIKKFEIMARYDNMSSNTPDGIKDAWNINKDNSFGILSLQYTPVKGIKTALNFRHIIPTKDGTDPMYFVYMNLEFKF